MNLISLVRFYEMLLSRLALTIAYLPTIYLSRIFPLLKMSGIKHLTKVCEYSSP